MNNNNYFIFKKHNRGIIPLLHEHSNNVTSKPERDCAIIRIFKYGHT